MAAFGLLPNPPASITARLATIARGPALAADVAQAEVTDASFATVERLAHWAAAGSMWSQRPWLGQGPGHYEIAYAAHRLPRWPAPLGHAHNDYLQALAETGLLGLLAWLALLAALLWTCARAALGRGPRRGGLWRATLGLGALGVWAATVTHGLFDRLYVHDMTVHLGLLTGLVLATAAGGALLEREA
jgi:O-antigen ligase